MATWQILTGETRQLLKTLRSASVQMVCTSPPYWNLRDYGTGTWNGGDPTCSHTVDSRNRTEFSPKHAGTVGVQYGKHCEKCGAVRTDEQIGLEETHDDYVAALLSVFDEIWRVLRDDGTVWLNLGDSYASAGGIRAGRDDNQPGVGARSWKDGGTSDPRVPATNGIKPKDLVGMPWRVAFALQAVGWYLRNDIIWSKGSMMPESIVDRFTKSHEYIFLLAKSERYFIDMKAVAEPCTDPESLRGHNPRQQQKFSKAHNDDGLARTRAGLKNIPAGKVYETRNKRDVWQITPQAFPGSHFAVMPEALAEVCILAGSRPESTRCDCLALYGNPACKCPTVPGDTVLDPFCGSGTTGVVAIRHGRNFLGIDLNQEYVTLAKNRLSGQSPLFSEEGQTA